MKVVVSVMALYLLSGIGAFAQDYTYSKDGYFDLILRLDLAKWRVQ